MATPLDDRAVDELAEQFRGTVLRPTDAGYDEARTVWNAMIDRRPAVIAQCAGAADVISAVTFAREHDLVLAVKAGGHNAAGNAVCDDGLVIDLSPMKSVQVDPDAMTVRVGPGVTLGEMDHETQAFGLAAPGGIVSTTGVAGLTLGGGWGYLSRKYGLAIDNLRSVDIVTADGELRHASETENEDLFWAVRGGGGNFGVVTSFEFDCHEVGPEVVWGLLLYPYENAADLLRFHREFTADAPDELCCYAAIMTAPPEEFVPEAYHGETVVGFIVNYAGDLDEGLEAVQPLREAGEPITDLVDVYPFTVVQSMFDTEFGPGARNYWKTQFVGPLSDEAIDVAIEHAANRPSPETQVVIEHLGGQISRTAPDATAYRHRDASFSFNIFPRWDDPAEDDRHIEWAQSLFDAMAPYTMDGVYVNMLSQEGAERVRTAYGDNYDRLAELKAKYDPENLFRVNQNIEPAA
ncbi:FAD-binding oxidoreductase [Halorarius litoreus]|uniref:FAD-binding oxidoreductase n=1 Tax=Halorarius litoreus TaxID=2962676 RepID=UPI0020CB7E3F|nr:FAD-binding oxidoreductase [Halorarius litoreus]